MNTFNRDTLKIVRESIDTALEDVCSELGISLTMGSFTYASDGNTFTTRLEGAIITDGKIQDKERTDWAKEAFRFRLDPDWLDDTFTSRGEQFSITGLNMRAKKYRVKAQSLVDGREFKFTTDSIRHLMGGISPEREKELFEAEKDSTCVPEVVSFQPRKWSA